MLAEPIVYYVETCDNPDQDHHNHNSHNADGAQSAFHAFSAKANLTWTWLVPFEMGQAQANVGHPTKGHE